MLAPACGIALTGAAEPLCSGAGRECGAEDAAMCRVCGRSGTHRRALDAGRAKTVEGAGKSLSPDSLAAIRNALAGEASRNGGRGMVRAEKGNCRRGGRSRRRHPQEFLGRTACANRIYRRACPMSERKKTWRSGIADVAAGTVNDGRSPSPKVRRATGPKVNAQGKVGQRLIEAISRRGGRIDVQDDELEEGVRYAEVCRMVRARPQRVPIPAAADWR